jgi:hypothetical protein
MNSTGQKSLESFATLVGALLIAAACKAPVNQDAGLKSAPLRSGNCGNPQDKQRANPNHCEGDFFIAGPYNIRPEALNNFYYFSEEDDEGHIKYDRNRGPVVANRYGMFNMKTPGVPSATTIGNIFKKMFIKGTEIRDSRYWQEPPTLKSSSTGKVKYLRELHYHLGRGRVGVRIVPAVDRVGGPFTDDGPWYAASENVADDCTTSDDLYCPVTGVTEGCSEGKVRCPHNPFYTYDPSLDNLRQTLEGRKSIYGSEEVDKLLRLAFTVGPDKIDQFMDAPTEQLPEPAKDPDYPIFAAIAYTHPEQHVGTLKEVLTSKFLKTENGITHLGAYIGRGLTRNSPYLYHSQKWWDDDEITGDRITHRHRSYPPHLYSVSLKGADQRDLNYNMILTNDMLNEFGQGVVFPDDYKRDNFRAINLKETLDFFRGWIDRSWVRREQRGDEFWTEEKLNEKEWDELREIIAQIQYATEVNQYEQGLRRPQTPEEKQALAEFKRTTLEKAERFAQTIPESEIIANIMSRQRQMPFYAKLRHLDTYRTYCAEHITININLGLNLVQNEEGYVDAYGEDVGRDLWQKAKEQYMESFGELNPGNAFQPLWKKHGISQPTLETTFGKSLAWEAETTADLLANFIENYVNFVDQGMSPYYTIAAVTGMLPTVVDRIRITAKEYVELIRKPIFLIMKHSWTVRKHRAIAFGPDGITWLGRRLARASKKARLVVHLKTITNALLSNEMRIIEKALKEKVDYEIPDLEKEIADKVISMMVDDADFFLDHLEAETSATEAWANFLKDVKPFVQSARKLQGGSGMSAEERKLNKIVLYYSPPGVMHRITANMYPHVDPYVQIQELATVMSYDEVCYTGRRETVYDPLRTLRGGTNTCTQLPSYNR